MNAPETEYITSELGRCRDDLAASFVSFQPIDATEAHRGAYCSETTPDLLQSAIVRALRIHKGHAAKTPLVVDDSTDRTSSGVFRLFSVRHYAIVCIEPHITESTQARGWLWVGFEGVNPPSHTRVIQIQERASIFAERLLGFYKEQALHLKLSRVESSSHEKSRQLLSLSHDIRTPLNNISAILHLLREPSPAESPVPLINSALRNCETAAEMLESMLEFSRHQAGQTIVQIETFDTSHLIRETLDAFKATIKNGINCSVAGCEKPLLIKGDRRHTSRIVQNLLSNALKYTSAGTITISLSEDRCGKALISVTDTGRGMSPEQLNQLFVPFTRFHEGTAPGVGLGLAFSKSLAQMMHGELSVRSMVGKGSTFTLSMPRADSVSAQFEKDSQPIHKQGPRLNGITALLVDDDNDLCASLSTHLQRAGAEAICASNVSDALSILNFAQIDVVISDIHMNGSDIRALFDYLNEARPLTTLIVLSGSSQPLTGQMAKKPWLMKPVTPEVLIEAVRGAVEGQPGRASIEFAC